MAPAVEPAIIDRRALGLFFFSGVAESCGIDAMVPAGDGGAGRATGWPWIGLVVM